ncbi:MAG: ATP-dependent DNA ligase [Chloroflexota bacterium]
MSCEAHRLDALKKIGQATDLEAAFQQGKIGNGVAAYADAKRTAAKGKVGADIVERWNTRVVPAKLHERGAAGADEYLDRYGKGVSAEKVIKFALQAEASGATAMANRFWARAYALENKLDTVPAFGGNGATPTSLATPTSAPSAAKSLRPISKDFPSSMQPGKFTTMQPVDADVDREALIADDSYWAQPKRDGERRVVFAGDDIAYQSRSTSLKGTPSPEVDVALQAARHKFGPFILDGEVYFPDVNGGEHRSAAQAFSANAELGKPDAVTPPRLAIFKALYAEGKDLTGRSEEERIAAGEKIGAFLAKQTPQIEVVPTARTAKDKAALVKQQQKEGRDGEVWVKHNCRYSGGKQKGGAILRTKNIQEMDVVITGLTPTTAAGRAFGAIEVAAYQNGKLKPLGSIGTGFTQNEMTEIAAQFKANPQGSVITIASQGFTEKGQVWHGRYRGLRDDKTAEECVLEVPRKAKSKKK